MPPSRPNLTAGLHVPSRNIRPIPAGFVAGIWKKEDAAEIAIEDVAGRKGLSLKNADGSVSAQFFPNVAIAELRGGQTYTLKVVHWGANNSGGRVEIRKPQGVNRI